MLRPIIEQATPDGQGTSYGGSGNPPAPSRPAYSTSEEHFPPKEYIVINTPMDVDKVMGKLMEFNQRNNFKITDEQLTTLRLLHEHGIRVDDEVYMRSRVYYLYHFKKNLCISDTR